MLAGEDSNVCQLAKYPDYTLLPRGKEVFLLFNYRMCMAIVAHLAYVSVYSIYPIAPLGPTTVIVLGMKKMSLPRPLEDKKAEDLLVRLEKLQATTRKPPQSVRPMIRLYGTAHQQVFFST